ncbi:MAG: hypothetical protein ACI4E1_08750 [Lachnospira sp.]
MELNGVNSSYSSYVASATGSATNSSKGSSAGKETAKTDSPYSSVAATYTSSSETSNKTTKSYANPALVAQLKADQANRQAQLQSLVANMFSKQGITIGTADEMWKKLASGDFTADADTIAKAKEDISEDGYWGVKQTSERIFSFAQALAGDDEEMMTKMKEAVEKGFKEATKAWGKELPSISKDTLNAVMDKFDNFFNSKKVVTE